jgi:hypothetical protein
VARTKAAPCTPTPSQDIGERIVRLGADREAGGLMQTLMHDMPVVVNAQQRLQALQGQVAALPLLAQAPVRPFDCERPRQHRHDVRGGR